MIMVLRLHSVFIGWGWIHGIEIGIHEIVGKLSALKTNFEKIMVAVVET